MDEIDDILPASDQSSDTDSQFSNETSSSGSNILQDFLHSSSDEAAENEDEGGEVELFPVIAILLNGRLKHRVHDFIEVARRKSDEEFRDDFRVTRNVFNIMLDSLSRSGKIPNHAGGRPKISAELSLLTTLWFVANKTVHRTVANLFGISDSSVHRIVGRVLSWLLEIMPQVVVWPKDNEILRISQSFEQRAGIANCIGAIDGSHIPIQQPVENGRDYFNRKQSYSIVLQAVVDCDMKFTNLYCGDPGSFHDVRVLRRSNLFHEANGNFEAVFPNSSFLLGDKGYIGVGHKWIVTPFRDGDHLIPEQSDFNKRVSSTRVVVEQAFGILKSRFRKLKMLEGTDLQFMVNLVLGCCVLHNLCISNGDLGQDFVDDVDGGEVIDEGDNHGERENDVPRNERRQLKLFSDMYPDAELPQQYRRR